ncbi:hypothetical protein B0187_09200 [Haemophilus paracuniculus]|uniref:Uncharacterized protein n=1 Tax=Haemophilus paracuniculus TaxID=734 RepID=A0A1T0ARC6_9PAST|nr:hypothetical protein [Haemophilus paracuniculus]OOR98255.1 hypothetical protein B0187_09200 [Haemophilus paracuniculus]
MDDFNSSSSSSISYTTSSSFDYSSSSFSGSSFSSDSSFSFFSNDTATKQETEINPATGLPMMGGIGGLDAAGNPYGSDLSCSITTHDSNSVRSDGGSGQTAPQANITPNHNSHYDPSEFGFLREVLMIFTALLVGLMLVIYLIAFIG